MKNFKIIIISMLFIACNTYNVDQRKAEKVSLISVVANPEKFHNKTITVEGYFFLEPEGDAIYISKNDCDLRMHKNGIYLFIDSNKLSEMRIEKPYHGYVRLTGEFNKNIKGSYDFYSGTITVNLIERLQKFDSKGNASNITE